MIATTEFGTGSTAVAYRDENSTATDWSDAAIVYIIPASHPIWEPAEKPPKAAHSFPETWQYLTKIMPPESPCIPPQRTPRQPRAPPKKPPHCIF